MNGTTTTNGYASLDQLRAASPLAERDLEPAPGVRVRIRALSRHAQHQMNQAGAVGQSGQDLEKAEHVIWFYGLVAPALPTLEDAAALFAAVGGSVADTITESIMQLSGLRPEALATSAAAFQPADARP